MTSDKSQYPLLTALLTERGLSAKGAYTTADLAQIFGCPRRPVQELFRTGELTSRPLPGRARCLSCDIEQFLEKKGGTRKRH